MADLAWIGCWVGFGLVACEEVSFEGGALAGPALDVGRVSMGGFDASFADPPWVDAAYSFWSALV